MSPVGAGAGHPGPAGRPEGGGRAGPGAAHPTTVVQVEEVLVTMMTHPEAVALVRGVEGLQLRLVVQRGELAVPR